MTLDASRTDLHTARLAHRDRRRAELLAVIRYLDRQDEAPAARPARVRRALVPILAAAAVVGAGTTGWVLSDDSASTKKPAAQEGSAAGQGRPGGQQPVEGVPLASAKAGDPVPWQLATEMLRKCIATGREQALTTGNKITQSVEPPDPDAVVQPEDPPQVDAPRPEETEVTRIGRAPSMNWNQPEDSGAYRPYFTAWSPRFADQALRPLVVGKGEGPGLLVCSPIREEPMSQSLTGVVVPDGLLYEAIDAYNEPFAGSMGPYGRTQFTQTWGRVSPNVARVNLVYPNGYTTDAVLRNGFWFSFTATALLAPITDSSGGAAPSHLRAFDAAGTELVDNPQEDPMGLRRLTRGSLCYRLPEGRIVARNPSVAKPAPESCRVAGHWNGTTS
jgi:hypothetical protein